MGKKGLAALSVSLNAFLTLGLLIDVLAAFQEDWSAARLSHEPDFATPIENTTIPAGREAILTCSVSNIGRYKVAWVRAEDQTILSLHTKVVTHNNRVSVTHEDAETWKLRIRPVKESDRGCYLCQINTPVLKSQKGCLDVYVPPDILNEDTSGDMSVSEGENATVLCKAPATQCRASRGNGRTASPCWCARVSGSSTRWRYTMVRT